MDQLNSCILLKEPNKVKSLFFFSFLLHIFKSVFYIWLRNMPHFPRQIFLSDFIFWLSPKQEAQRLRRTMFLLCRIPIMSITVGFRLPFPRKCLKGTLLHVLFTWQRGVHQTPGNQNDSHAHCRANLAFICKDKGQSQTSVPILWQCLKGSGPKEKNPNNTYLYFFILCLRDWMIKLVKIKKIKNFICH